MEIPQEVQNKLKCSECDEMLSCGPVYLEHETGEGVCGRCSQQLEEKGSTNERTRNKAYEATASLLAFPCAFATRGCPEKVKFTLGQPPHESCCEFRPFICPIVPRGSCDWIDSWPKLKEHCDEKHPANVFKNPCTPPRPDLTTLNVQTYLISAYHFLFLLHTKVCITSGKLFHSLQMFGDSESIDKFSFTLEIKGNNIKLIKSGSVLRAGLLTIQEPTSIWTTINSLLDILDGLYNESIFTIRIQALFKFCLNCFENIDNVFDSKFCEECSGKLLKCKFNEHGCSFVDVNKDTLRKHESLFCKHQTKCHLCEVNFVGGSFIQHLISSNYCRNRIKSNINSVVRLTENNTYIYTDVLLASNCFGNIVGSYKLADSKFELVLFTSLPTYELKNFKCSIKLTDPQTKHSQILTPQFEHHNWFDWNIEEKVNDFQSWESIGIDIKINIDRI